MNPPQANRLEWGWRLAPEDLEGIENSRAQNARAPLSFKLLAKGILQDDLEASGTAALVAGEGNFEVPVSEDYLDRFGYNLPPSAAALAGYGAMLHPTWADATKRLTAARKHLLSSDDHVALIACLHEFERMGISGPYRYEPWFELIKDLMPGQKASALASSASSRDVEAHRLAGP